MGCPVRSKSVTLSRVFQSLPLQIETTRIGRTRKSQPVTLSLVLAAHLLQIETNLKVALTSPSHNPCFGITNRFSVSFSAGMILKICPIMREDLVRLFDRATGPQTSFLLERHYVCAHLRVKSRHVDAQNDAQMAILHLRVILCAFMMRHPPRRQRGAEVSPAAVASR